MTGRGACGHARRHHEGDESDKLPLPHTYIVRRAALR